MTETSMTETEVDETEMGEMDEPLAPMMIRSVQGDGTGKVRLGRCAKQLC